MSADDFQSKYASVMESMLKSAIAETTKLFETMVNELKAEISEIKKENEVLKTRCSQYETAKEQPCKQNTENRLSSELSGACEKCDTAIQCDLGLCRTVLVEQCPPLRLTELENHQQQFSSERGSDCLQEHNYVCVKEGNPKTPIVHVKPEVSFNDASLLLNLKEEEFECPVTPAVVQNINEDLKEDFGSPANIIKPVIQGCTSEENIDADQAASQQTSLEMNTNLPLTQNHSGHIQQALVISLKDAFNSCFKDECEVSQITESQNLSQESLLHCDTPVNEQNKDLVEHTDHSPEKALEESVSVNKEMEERSEELDELESVEDKTCSTSNILTPRRRGRPPKKARKRKSLTKSTDVPKVQKTPNAPLTNKTGIENSSVFITEKVSSSKPSEKNTAEHAETLSNSFQSVNSIQVNEQNDKIIAPISAEHLSSDDIHTSQEITIDSTETQTQTLGSSIPSETKNTSQADSLQMASSQPEKTRSTASLQDAMLLVEAMNQPITNTPNSQPTSPKPQYQCMSSIKTFLEKMKNNPTPPQKTSSLVQTMLKSKSVNSHISATTSTNEAQKHSNVLKPYGCTAPKVVPKSVGTALTLGSSSVETQTTRQLLPVLSKKTIKKSPQTIIIVPKQTKSISEGNVTRLSFPLPSKMYSPSANIQTSRLSSIVSRNVIKIACNKPLPTLPPKMASFSSICSVVTPQPKITYAMRQDKSLINQKPRVIVLKAVVDTTKPTAPASSKSAKTDVTSDVSKSTKKTNFTSENPGPSFSENLETPICRTPETPICQTPKPPVGENHETPAGENHETPAGENHESPAGENHETPAGENHEPPVGENHEPPVGENHEPPVGENHEPPVGENHKPPVGENHEPPVDENHEPPVSENPETSVGEDSETPVSQNLEKQVQSESKESQNLKTTVCFDLDTPESLVLSDTQVSQNQDPIVSENLCTPVSRDLNLQFTDNPESSINKSLPKMNCPPIITSKTSNEEAQTTSLPVSKSKCHAVVRLTRLPFSMSPQESISVSRFYLESKHLPPSLQSVSEPIIAGLNPPVDLTSVSSKANESTCNMSWEMANTKGRRGRSSSRFQLTSNPRKELSYPHLQMTQAQFLAQLCVSPLAPEIQANPNDSAVSRNTRTRGEKDQEKISIVNRLRSHLKDKLKVRKSAGKKADMEKESTPTGPKKPKLAEDTLSDKSVAETVCTRRSGENRNASTTGHFNTTSLISPPPSPCDCGDMATFMESVYQQGSDAPESFEMSISGDNVELNGKGLASVNPKHATSTEEHSSPEKTELVSKSSRMCAVGTKNKGLKRMKSTSVSPQQDHSTRRNSSRASVGGSPKTKSASVSPARSTREGVSPKKPDSPTTPKISTSIDCSTNPEVLLCASIKSSPVSYSISTVSGSLNKVGNETVSQNVKDNGSTNEEKSAPTKTKRPIGRPPSVRVDNVSVVTLTEVVKTKRRGRRKRSISKRQKILGDNQGNSKELKKCRATVWYPPTLPPDEVPSLEIIRPPPVVVEDKIPEIPLKPTPIVSPLQPLAVIGKHLLRNQCGQCGRVFTSSAALESHVGLHVGYRLFTCSLCGKVFPDSKTFKRHDRVHRNGRIHVCQECGKGFVYRFGLSKHQQMVHSKIKPFICQLCNKGFFSKRDVEIHIRLHSGEKPFKCHLCEKKFARRVELNVHLRWHNGEKRHWCPYCGKGFLDANNLKRHKLTHTGEKPHTCPVCSKKFTQASHMKKHLKNLHRKNN